MEVTEAIRHEATLIYLAIVIVAKKDRQPKSSKPIKLMAAVFKCSVAALFLLLQQPIASF